MTYQIEIFDGGVITRQTIEASSLEKAITQMESQCREAEEVFEGNPDCEPRTEWNSIQINDSQAICYLSLPRCQDSAAMCKVTITREQ